MPKLAIVSFSVIIFIVLGWGLWHWTTLDSTVNNFAKITGLTVEDISISGVNNAVNVLEVSGLAKGLPMLRVNVWEVKQNIESQLKWVRGATVARRMPNKIEIIIQERIPAAIWRDSKGSSYVIDSTGTPIIPYAGGNKFKDLIILVGDNANRHFDDVVMMSRGIALGVTSMTWVGDRRWDIKTSSGIEILLPEKNHIESWHRAVEIFKSNDVSFVKRMDMRVDGKVFVS